MQNDLRLRHRRRSIRLKGYDYTRPGAYFVTVCAYQRAEIFGAVINAEMQLSALGEIVRAEWFRSAEIRKEIRLFADELVIMPNHLHGIVWIVETDNVRTVGADGVRPDIATVPPTHGADRGIDRGAYHAPLRRAPRSLASFIAGFKASVTSRAGGELNTANIWQRNYYEHIIRNEKEWESIWNYIDTNPLRWTEDQLHPSASSARIAHPGR